MNTAAKPHPLNNNLLIIYFIGGITSYEMKLAKDMFNKEKDYNVSFNLEFFKDFNEFRNHFRVLFVLNFIFFRLSLEVLIFLITVNWLNIY